MNSYVIERRGFAELIEAMSAFDSLVEQYEDKIILSKTELELFQLQIKPHSFVDAFSIIHGMAQKKDFARLQNFCLKLSGVCALPLQGRPDHYPGG